MIDLDAVERLLAKPWFTRSSDEDIEFRRAVSAVGMLDLITRLRQAEKDAARYRWLRCQHDKEDDTVSIFINDEQHGAGHLDAQIDEAMNGSNN